MEIKLVLSIANVRTKFFTVQKNSTQSKKRVEKKTSTSLKVGRDATMCTNIQMFCYFFFCILYYFAGDSMMYQHTVSGIGCSGNSPTSTPPNINACSSSTPPLANSNHQNNNSNHENNSDQLVRIELRLILLCYIIQFGLLLFVPQK